MSDVAMDARRFAGALSRTSRAVFLRRPLTLLAGLGFGISLTIVVAGATLNATRTQIPLTTWFGLIPTGHTGGRVAASVQLAGLVALCLLWVAALRFARPERTDERSVWLLAAAWGAPLALGPPLMSGDVYTYAAQGIMGRLGLDVYTQGPVALGNVPAVQAVDPAWRGAPSPYGPLATLVQHLAASIAGGSPLGAVIVFRVIAVVSSVAIGILAADLAGPRRVQALALTVLNPLLLLQVVSAGHLEGMMCALLLGCLYAANHRHWSLAILLGVAAGGVKAPGYVAPLAVIIVHGLSPSWTVSWKNLVRDIALALAGVVASSVLVINGWYWAKNLTTPTLGHTALAPASLTADVLQVVVPSASFDDLSTAGRLAALLFAAGIVVYLLATAPRRALNRTVGYSLMAVALLSPVVYPWYLLWGVVCLAPTARQARLDWLVLVCALGVVLSPMGFSSQVGGILSAAALVVAAAIMAPRIIGRRRAAAERARAIGLPA